MRWLPLYLIDKILIHWLARRVFVVCEGGAGPLTEMMVLPYKLPADRGHSQTSPSLVNFIASFSGPS